MDTNRIADARSSCWGSGKHERICCCWSTKQIGALCSTPLLSAPPGQIQHWHFLWSQAGPQKRYNNKTKTLRYNKKKNSERKGASCSKEDRKTTSGSTKIVPPNLFRAFSQQRQDDPKTFWTATSKLSCSHAYS